MEFHQVRYFLAVYASGRFTAAAKACGVSQPALTAAIKRLESEFEGQLFTRARSGATLTALGELVLPRMQRIAREHDAVDEISRNFRTLKSAPLKLGVLSTIGPARIAPLLNKLHTRAPGIDVDMSLRRLDPLLAALGAGDIDVAIGTQTGSLPEWAVVRPLYEERYVVLLPPEHPLLERAEVELSELDRVPYIDRLSCELRNALESACTAGSVHLLSVFRANEESWVESLVESGIGYAFLPEHSVRGTGARTRPLIEPELRRTVCSIRSSERAPSPAAELLWSLLPKAVVASPHAAVGCDAVRGTNPDDVHE